jgi:DNA-binding CsgD family transcriptional regulator
LNQIHTATLSDEVKSVLRDADMQLPKLIGKSHHLLYQLARVTASRFALVDSFYIGFYGEHSILVYPYSFDGKEYYDPNKLTYTPDSLAAWMLQSRSTYYYSQDGGALMHRGRRFGQLQKKSLDAVVVPLLRPERRKRPVVVGVMGIQTYTPAVYTPETGIAMEWLAKSLMLVLEREREDEARSRALSTLEVNDPAPMLHPENVVNIMLDKLQSIRRKAEHLQRALNNSDEPTTIAVDDLVQECYERQTETIELFLDSALTKGTPLDVLSDQERRIVVLLVEGQSANNRGCTNRQIANSLSISEDTVKSHLTSIFKKLGVPGRTGVIQLARNYVPSAVRGQ